MTEQKLKELIERGENSSIEFKSCSVRAETVAKEMISFANSSGGLVLLGIEDDGSVSGLDSKKRL